MPEVIITRLLALAAAVAALAGPAAQAKGPFPVDRVPPSIPAGGVNVTGVLVLLPAASMRGLISSAQAIHLAAKNADPGVWRRARTQLAVIRGPVAVAPDGKHSSWVTLRHEPAWIVTYTASQPQRVGFGPGAAKSVKHMSVVLDARDGRYVRGIYTS